MHPSQSLDLLVKERLKQWPQRPPGVKAAALGRDAWLRGRPSDDVGYHPFLKLPGSTRWRTLPDGLWFNFGGTPDDPYVDIFAIEACGSLQNLLDKRSRFAPSTHSLLAVCPVQWLLSPVMAGDPTPRWKVTGVLREPTCLRPAGARHARALRPEAGALSGVRPPPIAARARIFRADGRADREDGDKNPDLQALLARASATAEFPQPAVTAAAAYPASASTLRARSGRSVISPSTPQPINRRMSSGGSPSTAQRADRAHALRQSSLRSGQRNRGPSRVHPPPPPLAAPSRQNPRDAAHPTISLHLRADGGTLVSQDSPMSGRARRRWRGPRQSNDCTMILWAAPSGRRLRPPHRPSLHHRRRGRDAGETSSARC